MSYFSMIEEEFGIKGPHIVACPLSVVTNWTAEFAKWLPKKRVLLFHGPRDVLEGIYASRGWIQQYDVIVTTFEVIVSHIGALKKINWHSMVVDEAHKLKNASTN